MAEIESITKSSLIELSLKQRNQDTLSRNETHEFTRLLYACRTGDVATVQSIISQKKTDINGMDPFDTSPLILASLCGHIEVVQLLLESGAICQRDTFQGERCLYSALNDRIRNLLLSYDYTAAINESQPFAAHLSSLCSFSTRQTELALVTTDLTLVLPCVTNEITFKIHRFVAIARSPYLRDAILDLPSRRSLILPTHIEANTYEVALRYLYLIDIEPVPQESFDQIEAVSDLFKIPQLLNAVHAISQPQLRKQHRKEMTECAQRDFTSLYFDHIRAAAILNLELEKVSISPCQALAGLPIGTDIVIRSDAEPDGSSSFYPVHKVMLNSEWFTAMFSSGFKESMISGADHPILVHLVDVSPSIMELILEFFYSDDLKELHLSDALDLLYAADMLFIDRLKHRACSILSTAGNIDDLINGTESGFSIFDVIRAGWATRMRRLEESSAKYMADRLENFLYGSARAEFQDVVAESAYRIKERQETDSIELIDDIRYYLEERFRMRADEFGSRRIFNETVTDASALIEGSGFSATTNCSALGNEDSEEDEFEDGLRTGMKEYENLMNGIDEMLQLLNLDA